MKSCAILSGTSSLCPALSTLCKLPVLHAVETKCLPYGVCVKDLRLNTAYSELGLLEKGLDHEGSDVVNEPSQQEIHKMMALLDVTEIFEGGA